MLKINKVFFLVMGIVISQVASSQTYFTRTGLTEFKASVKAFEPVEAKNNSTPAMQCLEKEGIHLLFKTLHRRS